MKAIIAFLIVINLLFFAYTWFVPAPPPPDLYEDIKPVNGDLTPLTLLEEPAPLDPVPDEHVSDPPAGTGTPNDTAEDSEAEPKTDTQPVATITTETSTPTQTEPPPPESVSTAANCVSVGPFGDEVTAKAVADQIPSLGGQVSVREAIEKEVKRYWVLMNNASRAEAKAVLDDMEARGVTDYYLGKGNVISLGLYSDKRIAERRQADLGKLGYSTQVDAQYKETKRFWLDVQTDAEQGISESQWRSVLAGRKGAEVEPAKCP